MAKDTNKEYGGVTNTENTNELVCKDTQDPFPDADEVRAKIESGQPLSSDMVMRLLDCHENKDKELVPYHSKANIKIILDRDMNLSGLLKYNELTQTICLTRRPWWKAPSSFYEMRDVDLYNIQLYIEQVYGIKDSNNKVLNIINIVAYENAFHPIVDYFLEELPEWDGRPHVENLLPDYLGAVKNVLNTELLKLWMQGAINRVFHAGCKFDYMLVLVGEQGKGKSTFFNKIAIKEEWYYDNFNTIKGDAAFEKLRGLWIPELGELLALKSAKDVESVKAFISSKKDCYRTKYGKITEDRPRRCVFAGTTNSMQFLQDKTGNRRYLPIRIGLQQPSKNIFANDGEVEREVLQAWAEMFHLYNTEHPALVLPKELDEQLERVHEDFLEDDYKQGMIANYLENLSIDVDRVCAVELWEKAFHQIDRQPSRKDIRDISEIMRSGIDGWEWAGRQRTNDYGVQNCIKRSVHLNDDSVHLSDKANAFTEVLDDEAIPF